MPGDTTVAAAAIPVANIKITVPRIYHCKERYTGSQRQHKPVTEPSMTSASSVCCINTHATPVVTYRIGHTKPNTQFGGCNGARFSDQRNEDEGERTRMSTETVLMEAPNTTARRMSIESCVVVMCGKGFSVSGLA